MSININELKKSISLSIIIPLFVMLAITGAVFYFIYLEDSNEKKISDKQQIISFTRLLQSELSEKLAIIASSNIFIDFLTAGNITKKELMPKFLEELSSLKASGVIGLKLIDINRKSNFNYGKISEQNVTLKLCYLANRLDKNFGNCGYLLKLYFSKDAVLNNLYKINSNLRLCAACQQIDFFNDNQFGIFNIQERSRFFLQLRIQDKQRNILYYYFFVFLILGVFAALNIFRIRNVINTVITNPLAKLVENIQNNSSLEKTESSLFEINYLIDQINIWEMKLEKAQRLEKQAAIGKLSAQLAHDIRSPIAVMEITLFQIANEIPEFQLNLFIEAIQSIRNIANNLLENYRHIEYEKSFATNVKITTSQIILLPSLVEAVVSQKKQEWVNNPCNIFFEVADSTLSANLYCIEADTESIKRMLSNLLNNAYDALKDIRQIDIKLSKKDAELQLTIRDYGCGIPSTKINEVLNGLSLKHQGGGLGLSNAKRYIESINGKLILISILNKGTTVTLIFPMLVSASVFLPKDNSS